MESHSLGSWSRAFGAAVTLSLAVTAAAAVLPAKLPLSASAQRRAAMLSAGVDTMPVGTSSGVERARQARPAKD